MKMPRDQFSFRKSNQLNKTDKSLKQGVDSRIANLCNAINMKENHYTTSSCSGRVMLLKASKEKRDDLFVFVNHDLISFESLKKELKKLEGCGDLIYFKQEPCILHVACRSLEDAQKLIDLAVREAGWKRCGILGSDKRFLVELNSTEKLEFPIYHNKVLVDDNFLKMIVGESNKKLNLSWDKIDRLQKII